MADTLKILAQSAPAANALTDIYTVPAVTSAVVSSVIVCNQSGVATTFRFALAIAGAADEPKQYLYYNLPLPANDTFIATVGVTLATTDVVRVFSPSGSTSWTLVGVEIT